MSMPPRKKRKMNDSCEDCLRVLKDTNESLKSSIGNDRQLTDSSLCSTPKEFLDNASKTSSGYDDEEFNEYNAVEESSTNFDRVTVKSFATDFDDNDDSDYSYAGDSDGWTICSVSDEEYYGFLDGDCNSSTTSEESEGCFRVQTSLPLYSPSEGMKMSKNDNFSMKSVRDSNEVVSEYVRNRHLDPNNIHSVFKTLLEIEDITCLSEYLPFAQKDVILNWIVKRDFRISLLNVGNIEDTVVPFMDELVLIPKKSSMLSEASPPKYLLDILFPHPHENVLDNSFRRRVATIFKVSKTEVYFRFKEGEGLSAREIGTLSCTKYDVIIRPRRLPVRYQHRALELLTTNSHVRQYLFPPVNHFRTLKYEPNFELSLFNQTIASNPEQLEAVRFLVEGPNPNTPYVIFGPPGTGKTTTIVESILQLRLLKPRSRILVTAGSNSACDTIALRICKYFNSNCQLQDIEKRDPDHQKSILRIYSKTVVEKGLHLIDPELQANSNLHKGFHYYPSVKKIRRYGIIVATLCTVGKLVTGDLGEENFFSHIFIDEAGAATEPEALVGIMGIKTLNCRVVLSGDHKQLGPILKSERSIQLGLDKSLLERLLNSDCYAVDETFNYDRTIQARLKRNYRSHPEIVRLFNHLYYDNELIADAKLEDVKMAAKWDKLPNPNFPIIFQAVHGITEKDTITPSCRNNLEIQVLMWFLQRLLVDGIDGQRVNQSDIGVITPYRLQSNLIKSRLHSRGWHQVESGSVETFQGREKQIIIVSLVRSFCGLGFVRNSKRLNVILSRPKSLLILIGNPLTFKRHPDFEFVVTECRRNGTFLCKKRTRKNRRSKKTDLYKRL